MSDPNKPDIRSDASVPYTTQKVGRASLTSASLDTFLAHVERRAFRVAEFKLGNREDALDAVQTAMIGLVRHYSTRPAQEWTPAFWGILRRVTLGMQNRRKVRAIMTGSWFRNRRVDDQVSESYPTDTVLMGIPLDKQSYANMMSAMKRLPQYQLDAFILSVLEGLSVTEAAKAMGCSESRLNTLLERALLGFRLQFLE